ncbi:hypothetical protein CA13_63330 [Planctomycetes bacterium CA13]|uniref:Uncharacterized protein n=1 Tax=Novipirellula herctigrandis TaxID=2527986 RepID=A0A5C5ZC08_9BACT|nr:hypothetical protein CA13_63330 [Planctomycetes bacterium CA13]
MAQYGDLFRLPILDNFEFISKRGKVYAIDGAALERIMSGYAVYEYMMDSVAYGARADGAQLRRAKEWLDRKKQRYYREFQRYLERDHLKGARSQLYRYLWYKQNMNREHAARTVRDTEIHEESMKILNKLFAKAAVDATVAVVSIAVVATGVGGVALVVATVTCAGVSATSEYHLGGKSGAVSVATGVVNLIPVASELKILKDVGNAGKVVYVSSEVVANGALEYYNSGSVERACGSAVTSALLNVKGKIPRGELTLDQLKRIEGWATSGGAIGKELTILTDTPKRATGIGSLADSYISQAERRGMWEFAKKVVREVDPKTLR